MDLVYWLLLLKTPKLGIRTFYKVLKYFESPEQVFTASTTIRRESGLFKKPMLEYLNAPDKSSVSADLDWQKQDNCHIITLIDKNYPPQLKATADPPPILFVRGDPACLSKPQIAIVGSRNPTTAGSKNAHNFAAELAAAGLIITSGMASGVDADAHLGALEAGGKTIAVCGTGLDRVYPSQHKVLAHQISTKGCLVSEFLLGTAPIAKNFPRRNRVISALSLGTLVVEASIRSGTMVTAKFAAEQGREVFAIPSAISNPLAKGCHQLIKQGAKLVEDTADITTELGIEVDEISIKSDPDSDNVKNSPKATDTLLKCLSYEATTVDELVEKSTLSPQLITETLFMLELNGKVAKSGGAGFVLL